MSAKRKADELKSVSQEPVRQPRILPPPINPADDGKPPQPLSRVPASEFPGFFYSDDRPINRRGFRYEPCIANSSLPSVLYTQCETEPYKAGINEMDKCANLAVSENGTITNSAGYRSARANVCIDAGHWYFEVDIIKANEPQNDAHVRVGVSRREASLDAPVGSDAYGYGIGDLKGRKIHVSRLSDFMEPFGTGDVIGFEVCIPRKVAVPVEARRDRFPVKYKGTLYLESLDYVPTKEMTDLQLPRARLTPKDDEAIAGSFIKVYRNGELVGTLVEGLREFLPPYSKSGKGASAMANDGLCGYFPTISSYRGGQAKFDFGPKFAYPAPDGSRPLCERYDEQIADDVTLDVLDEVEFEETDAQNTQKTYAPMVSVGAGGEAPSREPTPARAPKRPDNTGSWLDANLDHDAAPAQGGLDHDPLSTTAPQDGGDFKTDIHASGTDAPGPAVASDTGPAENGSSGPMEPKTEQ